MSPRAYVSAEVDVGHTGVEVHSGKRGGTYDQVTIRTTPHCKDAVELRVWHDGERWCVSSLQGVHVSHPLLRNGEEADDAE